MDCQGECPGLALLVMADCQPQIDGQQSPNEDPMKDAAQHWNDVQAETGFDSYQAYLDAYKENRAHFRALVDWLETAERHSPAVLRTEDHYSVFDLSTCQNSSFAISLRCHAESDIELLAALRQPPRNVQVQVAFWHMDSFALARKENVVNKLGLGLRIDPRFCIALFRERKIFRRDDVAVETRPLNANHLVIGDALAYIPRRYLPGDSDEVSVILIARLPRRLLLQREDFLDLADQEVRQVPQFRPPIDSDPWVDHLLHSRYREVNLERMKAALGLNFA